MLLDGAWNLASYLSRSSSLICAALGGDICDRVERPVIYQAGGILLGVGPQLVMHNGLY